ncbi:hypothetical protein [Vampirovibrio sp.]|uniref:hypothetical protein n=1 Tax=Vampirovibrio sp. TaxID=2717857 RepID=UPI0035936BD4
MHYPTSHFRGLDQAAEEAFLRAYQSLIIFEGERPTVRFSRDAAEIFRQLAELRRKNWSTSTHWNQTAEQVGLAGELAVQFYLGISAETAMAEFKAGLMGDQGHDVEALGLKLDVKSTRGSALKFKFSRTNSHASRADGFIFTYVENEGFEMRVQLLGWSHRAKVKPHLRDDGQRFFVRMETLRREGALHLVRQLRNA